MARQLQGPEADLVPVAPGRARQRRVVARQPAPGVRRLALARVLDPAGNRNRVQTRGLRPGAERVGALSEPGLRPRQTRPRTAPGAMNASGSRPDAAAPGPVLQYPIRGA